MAAVGLENYQVGSGSKEDLCLLIAGLTFNSNASEKPPLGIWAMRLEKVMAT